VKEGKNEHRSKRSPYREKRGKNGEDFIVGPPEWYY
jgi:hypothetical protein